MSGAGHGKPAGKTPASKVGLLLGAAAATVGLAPLASVPVRPWQMLVALAVVIGMLGRSERGPFNPRILPLDLSILLFTLVRAGTEAYNSAELGYSLDLLRFAEPIFWLLSYAAVRSVVIDVPQAVALGRAFLWPALVSAPLAVAQALGVPAVNTFTSTFVTSDGFTNRIESGGLLRAVGLVGHWTSFGSYMTGIVALAVALLIIHRRRGLGDSLLPLGALGAAIVGIAASLTFSAGLIAFIVVLVCFRAAGIRPGALYSFVIAGGTAAVLLGAAIGERFLQQTVVQTSRVPWLPEWVPNTLQFRAYIWTTETLPMMKQRLLTGWGLDVYDVASGNAEQGRTYPRGLNWLSPESQWFGTAMTGGILTLACLVLLLVAALTVLIRARKVESTAWIARPVLALLAATVVFASTAPMLTNRGLPLVLWPLIAMVVALSMVQPDQDQDIPRVAPRRMRSGA